MIKKFFALLLLTLLMFAPKIAFADTTAAPLTPIADSYTDYFIPYAVQPNGALGFSLQYVEESGINDQTNYCYLNTETPFIKFDLGQLTEPIVSAELTLHLSEPSELTELPIKLVGAEDGWEESNLRHQTRILTEAEPFTGAVAQVNGTTVTFRSVDNSFAAWLEAERLGDGTATVTLKSTGLVGCFPSPIVASDDIELTFADRTDSVNGPTLNLSGSARSENVIPTAVTMSNATTAEVNYYRTMVFISVVGLITMTSVTIFYQLATKLNSAEFED